MEEYYNYWRKRTAGKMWQKKAILIVDESAGAEEEN